MKIKRSFLLSIACLVSAFAIPNVLLAEEQQEHEQKESSQLLIVNKYNNKLAMYENGYLVNIFAVATGSSPSSTPEGDFNVSVKWECPIYYKTNMGACQVGNPLGKRWIGLDVPGTVGYTYGIHGNAAEWSIGSYASAGCVRMHNWQVEQLFEFVEVGARVLITRSSESFDDIAKSLDYTIAKSKTLTSEAYVTNKTDSFYGLNEHLSNDIAFDKGLYKAIEEANGYTKIEDVKNKKTNWVRSSDVVVADFNEYENEYFEIKQNSPIFNKIFAEEQTDKFQTKRVVKPIISTDTWVLVAHNNEELWVRSSTLNEVSEKEFNAQTKKSKSLLASLVALNEN